MASVKKTATRRNLSVYEFGAELLRSGDLDPVYVAIGRVNLALPQRQRLCLAYWCLYHLGAAAQLSEFEGEHFWRKLLEAAANVGDPKPWPRGAERRHWRGAAAVKSALQLQDLYETPEGAVETMTCSYRRRPPLFSDVVTAVKAHHLFGDWIAFKIADMAERVLGVNVDFANCSLGVYKDPRQGAALVYYSHIYRGIATGVDPNRPLWDLHISDDNLQITIQHLSAAFNTAGFRAIGGKSRPIGPQEVETVLCKYKAYVKGHYPLGKDSREIAHGLTGWGPLADRLKKGIPVYES